MYERSYEQKDEKMKLVKMSLVASLLIGSSVFGIENVKVAGDAQLFYHTDDTANGSMFDKDQSYADAALHVNASADLNEYVIAGAGITAISSLGLENNLVSNTWASSHGIETGTGSNFLGGVKVENAKWVDSLYIGAAYGKTTAKIGRMELDTPLAFTETWTIEKNTFEAAVVTNSDLPETTLVGAYIGNGNGTETFGDGGAKNGPIGMGIVNEDGKFATYGSDGAYAIGAINNSFEPLTAQGWYYNVSKIAQAYWLQADLALDSVMVGAQYTGISYDEKSGADGLDSSAYAVMAGYEMPDTFLAKIAYSSVDKEAGAGFNTATSTGAAQSKLYTEAWWMYGQVTQAGADAVNVTLEAPVAGVDLGLYTTMIMHEADNSDVTEVTLTASKSFGPLDTSLAYIYVDDEADDKWNALQVYLSLNF